MSFPAGRRPNLFSRLRLFASAPGRTPLEDPLTEALAATFEAAPAAAVVLAKAWFGLRPEGEVTVTTQRWVRRTERLDLEVVFGSFGRPDFRLWFEAKVGAPPTREQACRYLDALGELPGEGRLSWLLPVGVVVRGGSPDGVPEHTWQRSSADAERVAGDARQGRAGAILRVAR